MDWDGSTSFCLLLEKGAEDFSAGSKKPQIFIRQRDNVDVVRPTLRSYVGLLSFSLVDSSKTSFHNYKISP
jgi:hypothetical protein